MGNPIILLIGFLVGVGLLVWLAWPRRGLLAVLRRRFLMTDRVMAEDALKHLFHEPATGPEAVTSLERALGHSPARIERSLTLLESLALIRRMGDRVELTDAGRRHAVHLVRSHRLWERFLADRTGVRASEWHDEAELAEHRLSPADAGRLAERMGLPAFDPHGDPIPTADGVLPTLGGRWLSDLPAGRSAVILHLEDEPRGAYEHLLAAGLAPGQRLTLTERDDDGLTIVAGGRRSRLAPEDAGNVQVREESAGPAEEEHPTLAAVPPGGAARVLFIAPACQGPQRRRLLDLGIVPDTVVEAEMSSALGDPVAYRIRGALIALRREQAEWVVVQPLARGASAA